MDWCNTKINGTELDPHTQYQQMVYNVNKDSLVTLPFLISQKL